MNRETALEERQAVRCGEGRGNGGQAVLYFSLCEGVRRHVNGSATKDPCMFFPSLDLRYFGGYAAGKPETNA